tara:strand:+ start:2171 stop:2779 length:609 start_codon:yes stop_codon:yes gene_type:complete
MIATVTESSTELNEAGTVTFTVTTTGLANGTQLYFSTDDEIDGTIQKEDFDDAVLTGICTITNNTGSVVRTISRDRTTEGTERFLIKIRENSTIGNVVGVSTLIRINDTSIAVGQNANGKVFGPIQVNIDNGVISDKSDWYSICNLSDLPEGSKVAIFIDDSNATKASYDALVTKLTEKNIAVITVTNTNEDWITPFIGALN